MRLDEYLVINHQLKSRNLAKETIKNGHVLVNGIVCTKPSLEITTQHIEITNILPYVSRAGLKLAKAIEHFHLDLKNKIILDVGASTGGFTDCCLQNGAQLVYAVDVGTDQLDSKLVHDKRVVNLSNTNIKDLDDSIIHHPIDVVVSDLSFISSKYMFEALKRLTLTEDCTIISLIKPQFELSPSIINKHHGKVLEKKYWDEAINKCKSYAIANGFKVLDVIESPIKGAKKQNVEFLMWCTNAKG